MDINILRFKTTPSATLGRLYINGIFQCITLEPPIRKSGIKIWGKTAIPEGVYKLHWMMSARFKSNMPYLLNVPRFQGVMFHAGNTVKDTKGCILLGMSYNLETLLNSRKACLNVFPKLQVMEGCTIIISNP